MIKIKNNQYYVYISVDENREYILTGIAGDLKVHVANLRAGTEAPVKNGCVYLVYWECYADIMDAISRERKLRYLSKKKKLQLINAVNPSLDFLNESLY